MMLLPVCMQAISNPIRLCATAAIVLVMTGCASPNHKAPVEDRGRVGTGLSPTRMPPGAENAGKPGYYTVKPGDTLIRIALESGQNWRDIAAWNNLENPNLIEVGQVVRVAPPASEPVTGVVALSLIEEGRLLVTDPVGAWLMTLRTAQPAMARLKARSADTTWRSRSARRPRS